MATMLTCYTSACKGWTYEHILVHTCFNILVRDKTKKVFHFGSFQCSQASPLIKNQLEPYRRTVINVIFKMSLPLQNYLYISIIGYNKH